MTPDDRRELASDPEFLRLEKIQARLSFGYAAVALGVFSTFVIAMIYWPEFLARKLFDSSEVSLALAGALLLIVIPLLIAGLYLRAVERQLDPLRERLKKRRDR